MSDELNKELAALAAKLGVSVEHIWGVLVRQAYIDGLSSLVTVFCCAGVHGAGYHPVCSRDDRRQQFLLGDF